MRKILLILLLMVVALNSCDQAPDGVIKESNMVDFLCDLYKAEALVDQRSDEFTDDASKQALKQAVFDKYGVTQEMYDSSMVWYAKNMEIYDKVYKKVITRLQDEQKELKKGDRVQPQVDNNVASSARKTYAAKGDTADIWNLDRLWMLNQGMGQGYISFEYQPDGEYKKGDRYQFNSKLFTMSNAFTVMLACEYADGTISMMNQAATSTGWMSVELQSDSNRTVRRVFGYVRYSMERRNTVAFVDSISLLRTHANAKNYMTISTQKFFAREKSAVKPGAETANPAPQSAPQPAAPIETNSRPATLQAEPENAPAPKSSPHGTPPKLYVPKKGVNKSGHTPAK